MKVTLLKLATALLTYAGFALFQAVANGQPLARAVSRRRGWRAVCRLLAGACVAGAASLLAPAVGRGAALLFVTLALMLAAGGFVLLAPVRPSLAWSAAVAAPFLAAVLILASQGMR